MSTSIPNRPATERHTAAWAAVAAMLPPLELLWRREHGEPVTDHRSSWVRRFAAGPGCVVYVKTYDYPTWGSRLRDLGKRTAPWGRPRPHREFHALQWLRAHDCAGPAPLAVLASRRLGFVRRASLVTEAFAGCPASVWLRDLAPVERIELVRAIVAFVQRLHGLGFRDRNLDLRNLLAARAPHGWTIAKIDSPRHRLRAPGSRADRGTRADWRRLAPQLRGLGVDPATAGVPRDCC